MKTIMKLLSALFVLILFSIFTSCEKTNSTDITINPFINDRDERNMNQYSYKKLNYVNPYSNFEEDEDSYISEFNKADMNAVDAIVNRNRALERKDYKEAQIYQKEYEYNSKLAQYYSSYEELNKKPNAFNLFLEKQNISEDQKQRLIPEYNKLIAQTFLKGLTQQYIDAEKKDALSNMPVPIGGILLQTNIVGGVSLNIPKFNIKTTGEDRENLIYNYLEKYFYEDINKQFETNEKLKNYYKPLTEEDIKKENERFNKESKDFINGKRTSFPTKPKYGNDFFQDLLYSTVDKTTNIKPEDAYYNGLYNFYNDIYKKTINVQAYGKKKSKEGTYDQSKPVTVINGQEPYIYTNIEVVNYTVGREINNMVEDFATRKNEQLIMSRSFDRLKYNEFKKSHAKELKTLALNSNKKDLEKKFDITLQSENGINQNVYNKVYNDFIRGEAKNKSGLYNDEERDAYKIIDAYLTDKDLLTSGEITKFKTNVQDGGVWYGALKLEETNLMQRFHLKFTNRLNSDNKQDRRTTITLDDGTSVTLKENVDPPFSYDFAKEELDEFTKIYEENKSLQEQQNIKSYINTLVNKEMGLLYYCRFLRPVAKLKK